MKNSSAVPWQRGSAWTDTKQIPALTEKRDWNYVWQRITTWSFWIWTCLGIDGLEILRQFRTFNTNTPVLILSARVQIQDKVEGLDLGANDYLTKPFHFEELEARIRSLTRRKFIQEDVCLRCSRITFDTRTREASVDGTPLALTRKESALLEYFLLHRNRIISPEEMIEHLWDGSVNSFSNSIRVHISSLRKKTANCPWYDPYKIRLDRDIFWKNKNHSYLYNKYFQISNTTMSL